MRSLNDRCVSAFLPGVLVIPLDATPEQPVRATTPKKKKKKKIATRCVCILSITRSDFSSRTRRVQSAFASRI